MSYKSALAAMKRFRGKGLIARRYRGPHGECCAIGAVCPSARKLSGVMRNKKVAWVSELNPALHQEILSLGMDEFEAQELQRANDFFGGTDKQRKVHVLNWLERKVAEEQG